MANIFTEAEMDEMYGDGKTTYIKCKICGDIICKEEQLALLKYALIHKYGAYFCDEHCLNIMRIDIEDNQHPKSDNPV